MFDTLYKRFEVIDQFNTFIIQKLIIFHNIGIILFGVLIPLYIYRRCSPANIKQNTGKTGLELDDWLHTTSRLRKTKEVGIDGEGDAKINGCYRKGE